MKTIQCDFISVLYWIAIFISCYIIKIPGMYLSLCILVSRSYMLTIHTIFVVYPSSELDVSIIIDLGVCKHFILNQKVRQLICFLIIPNLINIFILPLQCFLAFCFYNLLLFFNLL